MPRKQPQWYDEYHAAGILGDLFDVIVEVTKSRPKEKEIDINKKDKKNVVK